MYFSGAHVLHTLHFLDAKRLIEFQQYQMLMEKQKHLFDPFEPIKRLAMVKPKIKNPQKPLTSFRINDILADTSDTETSENSGKSSERKSGSRSDDEDDKLKNIRSNFTGVYNNHNDDDDDDDFKTQNDNDHHDQDKVQDRLKHEERDIPVIRPWNCSPKSSSSSDAEKDIITNPSSISNRSYLLKLCNKSRRCELDSDDNEEIDVEGCEEDSDEVSMTSNDISPLDALMAMSSKTFMGLETFESRRHRDEDQQNKSQIPKKKRKTRTAFTNQQIYELEKRFILQKYLTPSDRDEIAGKLGLSCAQVITWFQNRRAKFKRDIEEMKHDVVTSSPKKSETENETK